MNETIDMQAAIVKQIAEGLVQRSVEGYSQWLGIWEAVIVLAAIATAALFGAAAYLVRRNNRKAQVDAHRFLPDEMEDHPVLCGAGIVSAVILLTAVLACAICACELSDWTNSPVESVIKHEFRM